MFKTKGYAVVEDYLAGDGCRGILRLFREYSEENPLPLIHRRQRGRSLKYKVVDGEAIHRHFPALVEIYHGVAELANEISGLGLVPLKNRAASVNINVTPTGGEYRWHYDRNAVTAILYLNQVSGGETEMYPNYRIHLGRFKATQLQRWLDRLIHTRPVRRVFAHKVAIDPRPGMLLVMRGDRCYHSVRAVEGDEERINVIMTFDLPQASFAVEEDLDPYLYRSGADPDFDPNYR